jgi:hypothetical protein
VNAPNLLVGTHTFAGSGDGARRQANGVASLCQLQGVPVVNVQFADGAHHCEGLETLPVLRTDSNGVSGRRGPRKPIVSEIFDALAAEARRRACAYFCFSNGDIILKREAIGAVLESSRDAWVFSRQDFDRATGAPTKIEIAGTDVFALSWRWWNSERWRFAPYILGEGGWDNVYTAIVMCHAHAHLENRRPLVWHESHPPGPMPSPQFGQYIRRLAARDAGYFALWCRYWDGIMALRSTGATQAAEEAFVRQVFVWRPSIRDRAIQTGRTLKAELRYHLWRWRAGRG